MSVSTVGETWEIYDSPRRAMQCSHADMTEPLTALDAMEKLRRVEEDRELDFSRIRLFHVQDNGVSGEHRNGVLCELLAGAGMCELMRGTNPGEALAVSLTRFDDFRPLSVLCRRMGTKPAGELLCALEDHAKHLLASHEGSHSAVLTVDTWVRQAVKNILSAGTDDEYVFSLPADVLLNLYFEDDGVSGSGGRHG